MATITEEGQIKMSIPVRIDHNNPYPTGRADVEFIIDGDFVDIKIGALVNIVVDKSALEAILMALILT